MSSTCGASSMGNCESLDHALRPILGMIGGASSTDRIDPKALAALWDNVKRQRAELAAPFTEDLESAYWISTR